MAEPRSGGPPRGGAAGRGPVLSGPRRARGDGGRGWLLASWTASAAWLLTLFDERWIPHDEGTLAQTAWRILLGEVPHRDFDAVYTGLLGYLHAAAMAAGGESLLATRVVLLVAALAWIPAVWSLAARLAGPAVAALATVLAVAAGPAVYFAGMPSWYNLFLATWGVLALVRWDETGRARWLAAAGACAGVSVLVKVSGLYAFAAALFFVLHREASRDHRPRDGGSVAPAAAATALLAVLVAMEVALVRSQASLETWLNYVAPTLAIATVAAVGVWRRPRPDGGVVRRVAVGWLWMGVGFALPVAAFVAAFAAAGAADDLARGVFLLPRRRLASAESGILPLRLAAGFVVPLALVALESRLSRERRAALAVASALAGAALLLAMDRVPVYQAVWYSAQPLTAVATVAACVALLRRPIGLEPTATAEAVVWAAALFSLIQFPFSGPTYFAYLAPLGILAALVAIGSSEGSTRPLGPRPVTGVVAAFYLAFLVLGPGRGGLVYPPTDVAMAPLPLERGGLRVREAEATEYGLVVELLRSHSDGDAVYATPDVPEIYFLSGLRNPTRTLFEIFDEPRDRSRRVLARIEEAGVDAVALKLTPDFSEPDLEVIRELERRYPRGARVGRFIVRWRDPDPSGPD